MDESPKLRYTIDLARTVKPTSLKAAQVRRIMPEDLDVLAQLMLDAYRGTIDYEDETIQEAIEEVESWFRGDPMLEHSFLVTVGGTTASAVLAVFQDQHPFIGYVMTAPPYKNQGLGRLVVATATDSLRRAGYRQVTFYITRGNTPSEAMFRALGAVPAPEA